MSSQRTTSTNDSGSWGTDFGDLFEKFYTSHKTLKKCFRFENILLQKQTEKKFNHFLVDCFSISKSMLVISFIVLKWLVARLFPHQWLPSPIISHMWPSLSSIFDIHAKSCWWLTIFDSHWSRHFFLCEFCLSIYAQSICSSLSVG